MRIFSIDPATLVRYLVRVEQNYHADVPYHNSLHATDVIQTSHFLLQAEPLEVRRHKTRIQLLIVSLFWPTFLRQMNWI